MIKVGPSCGQRDARGACTRWSPEKPDVSVQLFAAATQPAAVMGTGTAVSKAHCTAAMEHVIDIMKASDPRASEKLREEMAGKMAECQRDATPAEVACVMAAKDQAGLEPCHALGKAGKR